MPGSVLGAQSRSVFGVAQITLVSNICFNASVKQMYIFSCLIMFYQTSFT